MWVKLNQKPPIFGNDYTYVFILFMIINGDLEDRSLLFYHVLHTL